MSIDYGYCGDCASLELEQARRDADESAKEAFRLGWEQCKREAQTCVEQHRLAVSLFHSIRSAIASMEYKEEGHE